MLFSLVLLLTAQAPTPSEPIIVSTAERPGVTFSVRTLGTHVFATDLKADDAGDLAVSRGRVFLGTDIAVDDRGRSRLGFSFDAEFSDYDFSGAGTAFDGAEDALEALSQYRFAGRYLTPLSPTWTLSVGGGVASSGESGADFQDTLSFRAFAGALCRVTDDFEIGPGYVFRTEFEDDPFFIPIIPFRWKIDERWRLGVFDEPRLTLEYTASDAWAFTLEGGYERRLWRLDDDAPVPEGAFRDASVPVGVGAVFKPARGIEIRADAGVQVWQLVKFLDDDGDEFADVETDPTPYAALEVIVRF